MRALSRLLIGLSVLTRVACATNQDKSYWLRHATVTLSQAAQIAETHGPGRAVGAELEQSGNSGLLRRRDYRYRESVPASPYRR